MSIIDYFNHIVLTKDQEFALNGIEDFLAGDIPVFMLKGYAGSGKTTLLKGLVDYLTDEKKSFALMAPTGRAAKVIRQKTGQEAYTIHKSIYSFDDIVEVEQGNSFFYYYKIRNNVDVVDKIFLVDEASMVSNAKNEGEFFRFGSGQLLADLITYTRVAHPNVSAKIIFVGDPCQLPPVGDNSSKAFDKTYLKEEFNLTAQEVELKEVKRQSKESGILNVAAKIRKSISSGYFNDFNLNANGVDIISPTYDTFLQQWTKTSDSKIIIASKNKTCQKLNSQIREMRFGKANLSIQQSDIVIVGANNYSKGVFNGEFAVVNETGAVNSRSIPLRGRDPVKLTWLDVELVFPDSEIEDKIVKGKILENFLLGDNTIRPEEMQALYVDFTIRHKELKPKSQEFRDAIIKDEYFNCLMLKYGYAVTCHKAQGGEWDNVFTIWDNDNTEGFNYFNDQQLKSGKTNQNFYRWAYTAITRAAKNLYALNPPRFNSYSNMSFLNTDVIASLAELKGGQDESEDIIFDDDILKELTKLNLLDESVEVQDHFIKVQQVVKKQFIDIVGWKKLGYEIRYTFNKENENAVFRTYINGKNEFRKPISAMPNMSPNVEFNNTLIELLSHLPNISIIRNAVETEFSKVEFDIELEERYPFTKSLFDDLVFVLKSSNIIIDDVTHHDYRERYQFKRNQEIAVLDFEYNSDGFFGRVVPLTNKSNSQALISDLKGTLVTFKLEDNAG